MDRTEQRLRLVEAALTGTIMICNGDPIDSTARDAVSYADATLARLEATAPATPAIPPSGVVEELAEAARAPFNVSNQSQYWDRVDRALAAYDAAPKAAPDESALMKAARDVVNGHRSHDPYCSFRNGGLCNCYCKPLIDAIDTAAMGEAPTRVGGKGSFQMPEPPIAPPNAADAMTVDDASSPPDDSAKSRTLKAMGATEIKSAEQLSAHLSGHTSPPDAKPLRVAVHIDQDGNAKYAWSETDPTGFNMAPPDDDCARYVVTIPQPDVDGLVGAMRVAVAYLQNHNEASPTNPKLAEAVLIMALARLGQGVGK